LSEIQEKLRENGHIYALDSLSPILIRLVRKREIRRVRDGKSWTYTTS
jgi:predicted transcriptional regulator